MKIKLETTQDFVNHLRHCIQEEHGIQLHPKTIRDITETILGANRAATKGSIRNMEEWRTRYFEQKEINQLLLQQMNPP